MHRKNRGEALWGIPGRICLGIPGKVFNRFHRIMSERTFEAILESNRRRILRLIFMKIPEINEKIGVGIIGGFLGKMLKQFFFNSGINFCEQLEKTVKESVAIHTENFIWVIYVNDTGGSSVEVL